MAQTLSGQLTALLGNIQRGGLNMYQAFTKLSTILTEALITRARLRVYQQFWLAPDAATTSAQSTQLDLNTKAQADCPLAVAGEVASDYPRNKVVVGGQLTGATSVIGTITGKDQFGVEQVETFTGSIAFAGVPVIVVTTITGTGGAGDVLDVGMGVKMGLNAQIASETDAVIKINMDEADAGVADGSADATNNTYTFETAPNAARDFMLWFREDVSTDTFDV